MPTISTIGSCRIAQPVHVLAKSSNGRLAFDNHRLYGFTHASKEAVQAAAYLLGHTASEEDAWPLLSERPYARMVDDKLPLGDVFIVEISSLKQLRFRGSWVKINLVGKYLKAPDLTRIIWRHPSADDLEERRRVLENCADYHRLSPFSKDVAREVIVGTATVSDIAADLTALRSMLGEVLVVTHCVAKGTDGAILSDRARCVDAVETAARSVGLRVYNPSDVLSKFGQRWAMPTFGLDTNHYTPEFNQAIAQDLREHLVQMHPSTLSNVFHEEGARSPAKAESQISRYFLSLMRQMYAKSDYEQLVRTLEFCGKTFADDPALTRELYRYSRSADIGASPALFKRLIAIRSLTATEAVHYLRNVSLDAELAQWLASTLHGAQPKEIGFGIEMLVKHGFAREAGKILSVLDEHGLESLDKPRNQVVDRLMNDIQCKIEEHELEDAVELVALASGIGCDAGRIEHALSSLDKSLSTTGKDIASRHDGIERLAVDHPECLTLQIMSSVQTFHREDIDQASGPILRFLNDHRSRIDEVEALARHAVSGDLFLTAALLSFSLAHLPERRQAAQNLLVRAYRNAVGKLDAAFQDRRPEVVEAARAVLVFEPRSGRALHALKVYFIETAQYQEAYDVMKKMAPLSKESDDGGETSDRDVSGAVFELSDHQAREVSSAAA